MNLHSPKQILKMGKLVLYGYDYCPAVRSVCLFFKALGLDYEYRPVDLLQHEQMREEFMKMNPEHTVPLLQTEDGKYIWDSHAIMAYLANRYAKNDSFYPKEHYLHALVDQRMHFDSGVLYRSFKNINVNI